MRARYVRIVRTYHVCRTYHDIVAYVVCGGGIDHVGETWSCHSIADWLCWIFMLHFSLSLCVGSLCKNFIWFVVSFFLFFCASFEGTPVWTADTAETRTKNEYSFIYNGLCRWRRSLCAWLLVPSNLLILFDCSQRNTSWMKTIASTDSLALMR